MSTTAVDRNEVEREPDLVRFARAERIVHWCTATLMLTLMATGAALYAGPVSTLTSACTGTGTPMASMAAWHTSLSSYFSTTSSG